MKPVIIESPYAAKPGHYCTEIAREYLLDAIRDCLRKGEAPFASHRMYTDGVLDDNVPEDRSLGIYAGLCWQGKADYVVVYQDLGISEGMKRAINLAQKEGRRIVYRSLKDWNRNEVNA